jgi:predicted acylesterase/phospholipase RssA
MLPVAHAFCACQEGEIIAISAVAGTSAGAICAALVAADCDFGNLRTYLKHKGKTHLNKLIPPDALTLAERIQVRNINIFDVFQSRYKLSSISKKGMPMLNEEEFGAFLDNILTFCSHGDKEIETIPKTKLSITATNLSNSCGVTFSSGSIKKALRDSALPLLFRSFNYLSINHHVDGCLCNNLPVNCLLDDVSAPIFAVFAVETLDPTPPSTVFLYLLSLFAASINHNDQRSKGMISDAFHFPVKTNFSTFSFSKALDVFGDDDWYDREYTKAYDKIVDFVTSYGDVHNKRQYRFIDTKNISDYIKSLESATKDYGDFIKHKYAGLIVRNKLDKSKGNLRRLADHVKRTARFEVTDKRFRYYRSAVSFAGGISAVQTVWHAFNKTKDKVLTDSCFVA